MILKIEKIEEAKTFKNAPYFKVQDSDNVTYSVFDMKLLPRFKEGAEIDLGAEGLKVEEKIKNKVHYMNIVDAEKKSAPQSTYEAYQNREARNISRAQDRKEVMFAKQDACALIANHPAYVDLTREQVEFELERLAKKILEMNLEEQSSPEIHI